MAVQAADPLIGARIGNCEIQRKIGSGGMGAVYLARHLALNKSVAIKVMSVPLTEDFVQRFVREAQMAAKLEHPNIVQIYDAGQSDGKHYLSMQYVDGRSLDRVMAGRGALPLSKAAAIVRSVAAALGAAHQIGIVHRDIKPENILISKDGVVKVADFGLARPVAGGETISQAGDIVGTPSYMSPEQAHGAKVDGRSDIYSLGATFYFLVTGRRPFEGQTPLSVVLKQIQEEPKPAHLVNPQLPSAVHEVIARMMAKDAKDRFQTMEEVVRAVDALAAEGGPRTRRTAAVPGRGGRRWIYVAAGVAVAAAGVALIAAGRKDRSGGEPRPTSARPAPEAESPKAPEPATPLVKARDEAFRSHFGGAAGPVAQSLIRSIEDLARALRRRDRDAVESMLRPPGIVDRGDLPEWKQRSAQEVERLQRLLAGGELESLEILEVKRMKEVPPFVDVSLQATTRKGGQRSVSGPAEIRWVRIQSEWRPWLLREEPVVPWGPGQPRTSK